MYHKIEIIGYLGRDPESRYTPTGQMTTSFSVAASRTYKASDGEKVTETVWFNVSAWGKLGEICGQYLRKGSKVFIIGRLSPDKKTGRPRLWEDKNGIAGASYDMVAAEIKFLNDREHGPEAQGGGAVEYAPEFEEPADEFSF